MVHQAGPVVGGILQRCVRCGFVLNDYRMAIGFGDPNVDASISLIGWEIGASIEVLDGDVSRSGLTDATPDCPVAGRRRSA